MSFINNEVLHKALQQIATESNFRKYQIIKAYDSIKGEGYLGVVTAIQIQETTKSENQKSLHLVIKSAAQSEALRKKLPIVPLFEREIFMYDIALPALQAFLIEKARKNSWCYPKCLRTSLQEQNEFLIFENVKERGFVNWKRHLPMDEGHVRFSLLQLANFHALSFSIKSQKPMDFERIKPKTDILKTIVETVHLNDLFVNLCGNAEALFDPIKEKKELVILNEFKNLIPEFLKSLHGLVDEHSVILHGDPWSNNFLFKYENNENRTKPVEMCFMDFQISRVGSVLLDFSYLLFGCGTKDIIRNTREYLQLYYESLRDALKHLGTDVDEVYPKEIFEKEWKKLAKFGLMFAPLLIRMNLSEVAEAPDLEAAAEAGEDVAGSFNKKISNTEDYNERYKSVILYCISNDLI